MGRPDSRLSILDSGDEDGEVSSSAGSHSHSRPFSGDTWATNDTSMDSSAQSFSLAHEDMRSQLEQQREDYEERLRAMAPPPAVDIQTERQFMQAQVEQMQQDMQKRLELQKKTFEAKLRKKGVSQSLDTPELYSPSQERCARKAVDAWRKQARVKIAEQALVYAVALKEANVISRELNKRVTYQFTVADRTPPLSASSVFASLADDSLDTHLINCRKPCLAIKVLDKRHQCIYFWSIQHFVAQLDAMRNVFSFVDKPVYSQHLNWDEPFYTASAPSQSFIGSALIPLSPLACNIPFVGRVEIVSWLTAQPVGNCYVTFKPKSVVMTPDVAPSSAASSLSVARVPDGAQITFVLTVDQCRLYGSDIATSLHCQILRSALTGNEETEEVTPSETTTVDDQGESSLHFNKEIALRMTPSLRKHLSNNCLPLDFFGSIHNTSIDRIIDWDAAHSPNYTVPSAGMDNSRKPEVELSLEQHHDVVARVSICELDASGKYSPVPVTASGPLDPGIFFLRQGLQRRLLLRLEHSSGRAWPWQEVQDVTLGDVRLLDAKGLVHASPSCQPLTLRGLRKESAEFSSDGTCQVGFMAPWDSSAHDSQFLDRPTAPSCRVLARLNWNIKAAGGEPVAFSMDLGISIQGRDARGPSKLLSALSSTRILSDCTSLFAVTLKPRQLQETAELWRRDTSKTYGA